MKLSPSIVFICAFASVNFISSSKLFGNLDDELLEAIVLEDTECVKNLLEAGATPDARESQRVKSNEQSALMYALGVARPDYIQMLLDAGANPFWECHMGWNGIKFVKLTRGVTTLELAQSYLYKTQNSPSIIERLCPCYRKKRIRNLKEIIRLLTNKMEKIRQHVEKNREKFAANVIITDNPQQALGAANAICRTNLALQVKRIYDSYQHQDNNDDNKEPGQDGEKEERR